MPRHIPEDQRKAGLDSVKALRDRLRRHDWDDEDDVEQPDDEEDGTVEDQWDRRKDLQ